MKNIIVTSPTEAEQVADLLAKDVPTHRQAYSDRTCWLMACFAELAYLRFNPLFKSEIQEKIAKKCIEEFAEKSKISSLHALIDAVAYDHEAEKAQLINELDSLNATLEETFDSNGTQAILISTNKFIVLAFRGTETTSIVDIKADLKAVTTPCASGGKIHIGFKAAYEEVADDVQKAINQEKFAGKPLFISGHSLGGALATIACKRLSHQAGIAASYTFGSPRVGDEDWVTDIKTPLYRLVNAADCVTMMPPGADTISGFAWLIGFFPSVGKKCRSYLLSKFGGYMHGGYMRYLTNCNQGDYDDVHLLYSVSFFHRIKMLYIKTLPWSKSFADHSISIYRKKLTVVAKRRN